MNKKQYDRLIPFLARRSARQRLILFLLADGMTVPDLVKFTVKNLKSLDLSDELVISRDEVLDKLPDFKPSSEVFVFPNGKSMTHTDFYRIVRQAAENAINKPMSRQQFLEFIQKGSV